MMDDLIGQKLGHYTIERKLGRGGMASVFLASDPSMEREVAIKILPREFASDPMYLERFKREVKVIAKLNHPNIVPVHAFGETDGWTYIVMAYMSGGTLAGHIRKMGNTIPLEMIASYLDQIGAGMDYAHSRGIIHRDFKPGNVLMGERGHLALSDFGIAKMAESTMSLTGTGMLGTPAYMAPELSTKGGLSHLVDVYALGVTLYEMVTGHVPFEADTPMGLLMAHMANPVPDARYLRYDIPAEVQAVIEKGMTKDPTVRFQSAQDMAEEFRAALTGAPSAMPGAPAGAPAPAEADDGLYTVHTPPPARDTQPQPGVQPTMQAMPEPALQTAVPEPAEMTEPQPFAVPDEEVAVPEAVVEMPLEMPQEMPVEAAVAVPERKKKRGRAAVPEAAMADVPAKKSGAGLSIGLLAGGAAALVVIVALALMVTGVVNVGALFAGPQATATTPPPPSEAPTSTTAAEPTLVTLAPTASVLYGTAEIRPTADGQYAAMTGGETIAAGTSIRTPAKSAVLLIFAQGISTEVHALTEVTISRMEADADTLHITLDQSKGTTFHFIDQGAFGLKQDYTVNAPNTSTHATGTQFWVSEGPDGWFLFPDLGIIDVSVGDPNSPSAQFTEDAANGGCVLVDRLAHTSTCTRPKRLVAITDGSSLIATVTPTTVGDTSGGQEPTNPPEATNAPPTVASGGGEVCGAGWLPASGCQCCGSTLVCADGSVAPSNPQCTSGPTCKCVGGVQVGGGCTLPGGPC